MFDLNELDEIGGWLKSPTLPKLLAQIEDRYVSTWKGSNDPVEREQCWRMIQCLVQVRGEMERVTSGRRIELHNAARKTFNINTVPTRAQPRDDA